jgi:hypothetical protein
MDWKIRAGIALVVSGGIAAAVMTACTGGSQDIGSYCPDWITDDCCPCPLPDVCPQPDPDGRPWDYAPPWGLEPLNEKCCAQWRSQPKWNAEPVCLSDLDGGTDGGDGGSLGFCASGTCVPSAPEAWKHVEFFMDWPREPLPCPDDAPVMLFEGTPAPAERSCPACLCDQPEGTCRLPESWTVSSETCQNGGGVKTNFDPPVAWDGSCTTDKALTEDKLCGGVPCVQSITISPPVIEEKPCTPHAEGEADLPVLKAWNDGPKVPLGRACASKEAPPSCPGGACVGKNPEFVACIMHDGDQACPEGWNGDRHVLYDVVDDTRDCTPCGCDAPTGGTCQVKFRTFAESSCSGENAANDVYANMIGACHDYMPGVALASKAAEILNYTKGSCAPTGGELKGDLVLGGQVTVCCSASTM